MSKEANSGKEYLDRSLRSLNARVLALTKTVEQLEAGKVALEARLKVLEGRPYNPGSFL